MKQYSSIDHYGKKHNGIYYVFDKLDGSNIRAEWNRKRHFYKFGSRKRLLDETDSLLGESVNLIKVNWEENLSNIFIRERFERVICFFEFYGEHSFAGNHAEEHHKTVLIDVDIYKRGLLPPDEYLDLFGHLEIPNMVYHGQITDDLVQSVKKSILSGMTFEGVVGKGVRKKKFSKPVMFKIKSEAWIKKLKEFCKGDAVLFKNLY